MWEDKGSELYNWWMKSWLGKCAIEIYSTHNEGKPVIAERFMRILKKIINRRPQFQKMCILIN